MGVHINLLLGIVPSTEPTVCNFLHHLQLWHLSPADDSAALCVFLSSQPEGASLHFLEQDEVVPKEGRELFQMVLERTWVRGRDIFFLKLAVFAFSLLDRVLLRYKWKIDWASSDELLRTFEADGGFHDSLLGRIRNNSSFYYGLCTRKGLSS